VARQTRLTGIAVESADKFSALGAHSQQLTPNISLDLSGMELNSSYSAEHTRKRVCRTMSTVVRGTTAQLLLKIAHNRDIEIAPSVVKGRSEVTQLVETERWKNNTVLKEVPAMRRCHLPGDAPRPPPRKIISDHVELMIVWTLYGH
jgi:hypothetical protein